MDFNLKGKSVVVTGGGSNIGRAIVLGFAAEGATLRLAISTRRRRRKLPNLRGRTALPAFR